MTSTHAILGASPSKRAQNADYCKYSAMKLDTGPVSKENKPIGADSPSRSSSSNIPKERALSGPSLAALSQTTAGIDNDQVNSQLKTVPTDLKPIFQGHVVYLASCLNLRNTLAAALISSIKNAKGECSVAVQADKLGRQSMRRKLLDSDIVICDRRAGWEFWTVRFLS
jgi:hypothetical protein